MCSTGRAHARPDRGLLARHLRRTAASARDSGKGSQRWGLLTAPPCHCWRPRAAAAESWDRRASPSKRFTAPYVVISVEISAVAPTRGAAIPGVAGTRQGQPSVEAARTVPRQRHVDRGWDACQGHCHDRPLRRGSHVPVPASARRGRTAVQAQRPVLLHHLAQAVQTRRVLGAAAGRGDARCSMVLAAGTRSCCCVAVVVVRAYTQRRRRQHSSTLIGRQHSLCCGGRREGRSAALGSVLRLHQDLGRVHGELDHLRRRAGVCGRCPAWLSRPCRRRRAGLGGACARA